MAEKYDVVVLGAGITGLTAAYYLTKKNYKVLILEKDDRPGGAIRSVRIKKYDIDAFYHHFFENDKYIINLIKELGLEKNIKWSEGSTVFLFGDRFFRLLGPVDLFSFKPFSFIDKISFILLMLRIKLTRDFKKADGYYAYEWIIKYGSMNVYKKLFLPLLKSKFGDNAEKVSAAWFIERIRLRSNVGKKGEILGYLLGSFQLLIDTILREVVRRGGKIIYNANVEKLMISGNTINSLQYNGKIVKTNHLVSSIPPFVLAKFVNRNDDYFAKLGRLEYQGSICILIGLDISLTRHYWMNIIKENCIFGAIVEHTNLIPKKYYDNDNIFYLGSYPDKNSGLWKKSDEEVFDLYFESVKKIFPKLEKSNVLWWKVSKSNAVGLIYKKGISSSILPCQTSIDNLYIGGMFNSYPERSINESIKLGIEIFKIIEEKI